MKIKKYVGKSFQEAFDKMRQELGGEAIILHSRKVKSGGMDFLGGREQFEITAAIDPAPEPVRQEKNGVASRPSTPYSRPRHLLNGYGKEEPSRLARGTNQQPVEENKIILQQLGEIRSLKEDVQDMKKVLAQVADFLKYSRMPALPTSFKSVLKQLLEHEVNEELANAIVQTVYARLDAGSYQDTQKVQRNIAALIARMIKTAPPLSQAKQHPYVVALVGPTGVGKTTTVAKLAANLKLYDSARVALVSADTYRIAAIEQLQTFANIASIPMSVAYSPEDMREAIHKFRDKDVILIDTVGRSQKHETHLGELRRFVEAANPDEVHLVLNLTASLKTMLDVVRRFGVMRPNRFIFSKLDETTSPGNLLNLLYKFQIPVSYVTNGQTVPNDILTAEASMLANLILTGVVPS